MPSKGRRQRGFESRPICNRLIQPVRQERSTIETQPVDYSTAAPEYRRRGLAPIPLRGKVVADSGCTGREGTVTDEKIAAWAANPATANLNIGIRAEGYIAIDVDAYGEKHGDQQLAILEQQLGALPVTISSTSRGDDSPSRQHFYRVPAEAEFLTKAADDIDIIQRGHRYTAVWPSIHPDTGAQYRFYDYEGEPMAGLPSIDDFEWLPEVWLEHLRIERPVYKHEQYTGPQAVLASVDEINQTNAIIRQLSALPKQWSEGSGWHDTVFGSAAWLSRMVNSAAYVIDEQRAVDLLLTHTPTYPSWGQDKVIEQWQDARKRTEGEYADIPRQQIPQPKPIQEVANQLPSHTTTGAEWFEILTRTPDDGSERGYWQLRHLMFVEALRFGLSDEDAVSLVWQTRSSQFLQMEDSGLARLWREVASAREIVNRENGLPASPVDPTALAQPSAAPTLPETAPAAPETVFGFIDHPKLLTDDERDEVAGVKWFGQEYLDYVEETLATINAPYHRLNRWYILSLIYSPHACLVKPGGVDVPLNIWGMTLGPSTSGKSESMEMQRTVQGAFFVDADADPDIGGDATPESLAKQLMLRDGKASWFVSDEASAHIEASRPGQAGYLRNLRPKLTDWYGGRVGKILRSGDPDLAQTNAKAFLIMQYAGIDEKIFDALEPSDWESGFLHRFVYAVGERIERTRDMKKKRFAKRGDVAAGKQFKMQKHWAAEFEERIRQLDAVGGGEMTTLEVEEWVVERDLEFIEYFEGILKGNQNEELLRPSVERFSWTIMKCAALVACSLGDATVRRIHYLVALEQAEEWLGNLLSIVSKTTQTTFRREVDKLEFWLHGRPQKRAKQTEIYRRAVDKFTADKQLEQLIADGRVYRLAEQPSGEQYIHIKEPTA